MAFKLSLRYKDQEVTSQELDTDDEVVARWTCRQLQDKVFPILKANVPAFKRAQPGDFERRIDRINLQLPLGKPVMNGSHP